MSDSPLHIEVSDLANTQIDAAERRWRLNRPKAPNAIREELERASQLISARPNVGAKATNVSLPGVRRLRIARVRYYVYYRVVITSNNAAYGAVKNPYDPASRATFEDVYVARAVFSSPNLLQHFTPNWGGKQMARAKLAGLGT